MLRLPPVEERRSDSAWKSYRWVDVGHEYVPLISGARSEVRLLEEGFGCEMLV